jgi:hypothetical protein
MMSEQIKMSRQSRLFHRLAALAERPTVTMSRLAWRLGS